MKYRFLPALALGTLVALSAVTGASAQTASWLDASPAGWNRAGAQLPPAPRAQAANTDRCTAQERATSSAEESALGAVGWRLTTFWPTVRAGDVAVVLATAGYDGMCRPIGYQAFVFVGNRFAGTLAPEPLTSRTDGSLATTAQGAAIAVVGDRIEARFIRYAASDPLCCPTRGQTRVSYAIDRGSVGPVAPVAIVAEPEVGGIAPVQLPRAGGVSLTSLAMLAGLLALSGGLALMIKR